MLVLRQTGLNYRKIAAALDRPLGTVYNFLQPLDSTVDIAQARLAGAADKAAVDLINASSIAADRGEHKAAVALLEASGAVKRQADTAIAIQVNMPGQSMPSDLLVLPQDDVVEADHAMSVTGSDDANS
jgi:hypothetical protein